jgi:hypothetical protein
MRVHVDQARRHHHALCIHHLGAIRHVQHRANFSDSSAINQQIHDRIKTL